MPDVRIAMIFRSGKHGAGLPRCRAPAQGSGAERLHKILMKILTTGGMRYVLLCLFAALAACNTAGPHFRGLEPVTVTVDGSTFDVRVRGELAEAIRTNAEYAPRFGPIRERAGRAMAMVSGCEVKEVRGDQAQATGILRCDDVPKRAPVRGVLVGLDCVPVRGTKVKQLNGVSVEIECLTTL